MEYGTSNGILRHFFRSPSKSFFCFKAHSVSRQQLTVSSDCRQTVRHYSSSSFVKFSLWFHTFFSDEFLCGWILKFDINLANLTNFVISKFDDIRTQSLKLPKICPAQQTDSVLSGTKFWLQSLRLSIVLFLQKSFRK